MVQLQVCREPSERARPPHVGLMRREGRFSGLGRPPTPRNVPVGGRRTDPASAEGTGTRWAQAVGTTRAVAMAPMPSPRPVKPSPSVVAAASDTGAPSVAASTACASSRRGPSLGRLPTTWTATLPMTNPASRTIRAASASRVTPRAPASSGRSVPKWVPRSPSPAAENSALHAAWATTSPSEWPSMPRSPGQVSPARCSGRSSVANAWTSTPTPVRGSTPCATEGWGGSSLSDIPAILQQRLGAGHVARRGHLERGRVAVDDEHGQPERLDQRGVVGGREAGGVSPLEHLTGEALRRLYRAQQLARRGRRDHTVLVNHLDGVDDGQAGHDRRVTGPDGPGDPLEDGDRGQRPRGVMDQDDVLVLAQRGEAGGHGRGAVGAAGDDVDPSITAGQRAGSPEVGRGGDDHDVVDLPARKDAPQRVEQQRLPEQRGERLGHTSPEPRALTGGDEDDAGAQEARTSSRMASALSSLVFSASASSETRIWRALASIRFSPAESPRSLSRRHRSRTTSATLMTSPEASFSRLAL